MSYLFAGLGSREDPYWARRSLDLFMGLACFGRWIKYPHLLLHIKPPSLLSVGPRTLQGNGCLGQRTSALGQRAAFGGCLERCWEVG